MGKALSRASARCTLFTINCGSASNCFRIRNVFGESIVSEFLQSAWTKTGNIHRKTKSHRLCRILKTTSLFILNPTVHYALLYASYIITASFCNVCFNTVRNIYYKSRLIKWSGRLKISCRTKIRCPVDLRSEYNPLPVLDMRSLCNQPARVWAIYKRNCRVGEIAAWARRT